MESNSKSIKTRRECAVLVLHHLTLPNRTVNVTNPVFITSVIYTLQPTHLICFGQCISMYVKRLQNHSTDPKSLLTFSFCTILLSNRAVYVVNPVGITSVGGLSKPILDMGWSEPFCIRGRYAWLFKPINIALTVLVLHHLMVLESYCVPDKSSSYHFGQHRVVTAYT